MGGVPFFCRAAEWITVSNQSAGNQRFCKVYMYMSALLCNIYAQFMCTCAHVYALCGYTRHLRTCRYVAIHTCMCINKISREPPG